MFDHVTIRASDRAASEQFYETVLSALGTRQTHSDEHFGEWGDFALAPATDGAAGLRWTAAARCGARSDAATGGSAGLVAFRPLCRVVAVHLRRGTCADGGGTCPQI
jgi:catechol 2,3-dioxygenase-like lactoylglutathione lyase family enzyme